MRCSWWERQRKNPKAQLRELTASRREIVNAFEIERRRIERDLHDGAQQHLVAAGMAIGEAELVLSQLQADSAETAQLMADLADILARAANANTQALAALRRTVDGIHPKVLSDLGLEMAVRNAAENSRLPVKVVVPNPLPPLPEGVVAAAYFLVSECLTNVAKYAPGAQATVLLAADENLHVSVVDTGPGGAHLVPNGGLAGLRERLSAFGGTLSCHSPAGGPTTISGKIPLLLFQGESAIVGEVQ
ncbi:MAG: histidine kinase [Trueperella sp.]|nr:histidine kinase [Trueperella sp.]